MMIGHYVFGFLIPRLAGSFGPGQISDRSLGFYANTRPYRGEPREDARRREMAIGELARRDALEAETTELVVG